MVPDMSTLDLALLFTATASLLVGLFWGYRSKKRRYKPLTAARKAELMRKPSSELTLAEAIERKIIEKGGG